MPLLAVAIALAAAPARAQQLFKPTASDAQAGDLFGNTAALSGNAALIGAYFSDNAGERSGSAYLFDVTTGQQLFKLTASDAAPGDSFGISGALSGSTAVVGAHADDDGGDLSGSAYLFRIAPVPEPNTLLLTALALVPLPWRIRGVRTRCRITVRKLCTATLHIALTV